MSRKVSLNVKFLYNALSYFPLGKPSKNKHFESSQKLRKDGIGIWENYIKLYAVYWYWYTVHARSQSFHLKLCSMLSELKMSRK